MDQEILRVDEFAKRVGYTVSTIRKKLLHREIKHYKVGRIVCIPASEVGRLLGPVIEIGKPGNDGLK